MFKSGTETPERYYDPEPEQCQQDDEVKKPAFYRHDLNLNGVPGRKKKGHHSRHS